MATIIRGRFRYRARACTVATLAARALLALALAFSAFSAIRAHGPFRAGFAASPLLPAAVAGPFALALPWLEVLVALYLVIGLFLRPMAVAVAALSLLPAVALAIGVARGAPVHGCGCLLGTGPLDALSSVPWPGDGVGAALVEAARALVFIGLSALIYGGDRQTFSVDGFLFGPLPADALDDEDLPPTIVLLTPLSTSCWDEDGA